MLLLKARLALELPPINKALSRAAEGLPHPVRPAIFSKRAANACAPC